MHTINVPKEMMVSSLRVVEAPPNHATDGSPLTPTQYDVVKNFVNIDSQHMIWAGNTKDNRLVLLVIAPSGTGEMLKETPTVL